MRISDAPVLPAPAAETYTAHSTAMPAVQFNTVYLTPCTAVPSFNFGAASDKRSSLDFMKTPTIGYEEDSTLSKRQIAETQLREAISLFTCGKFICALTLAGAAEEILARLLNARGEKSSVEVSVAAVMEAKAKTRMSGLRTVSESQLFQSWNSGRNSAKHHGPRDDDPVVMKTCDEAFWMIRRALQNAQRLGLSIENEQEFENWVAINVNM